MSRYELEIHVTPRPGLLDPEGQAIQRALHNLEFPQAQEVRVGKMIHMEVEAESSDQALEAGEAMCRKLLANPVTEDFSVEVLGQVEEEAGT